MNMMIKACQAESREGMVAAEKASIEQAKHITPIDPRHDSTGNIELVERARLTNVVEPAARAENGYSNIQAASAP